MSRKKHTHIRGERGQAFADKIRGIPMEQILCVSLDIHKYFHVVIIHDAAVKLVINHNQVVESHIRPWGRFLGRLLGMNVRPR